MSDNFTAFPKIGQFKQAIREVRSRAQFDGLDDDGEPIMNRGAKLPTLAYRGTIKLHGTNAGIGKSFVSGNTWVQSRSREISTDKDNCGFARFMDEEKRNLVFNVVEEMLQLKGPERIVIYGEWAGKGVQKGVAISELDKMFVIVAIKVGDRFINDDQLNKIPVQIVENIFTIFAAPVFDIKIDFSAPELIQNQIIEMTMSVEKECPFGKVFDVSGVGEGIVFHPIDPDFNDERFWFKSKGEKHSASKVKVIAEVDEVHVANVAEFVDKTVTENRLNQGIESVKEQNSLETVDRKHMGLFLRWVANDIFDEEGGMMEESGLTKKDLGSKIAQKSKEWFFEHELEF